MYASLPPLWLETLHRVGAPAAQSEAADRHRVGQARPIGPLAELEPTAQKSFGAKAPLQRGEGARVTPARPRRRARRGELPPELWTQVLGHLTPPPLAPDLLPPFRGPRAGAMVHLAETRRVCRHFDAAIRAQHPELAAHAASLLSTRYLGGSSGALGATARTWLARTPSLQLCLPYWEDTSTLTPRLDALLALAPELRRLEVKGVRISGLDVSHLALARVPQLTALTLQDITLGDEGFQSLPLSHVPALRELVLGGNGAVPAGPAWMARPSGQALRLLQVRHAKLTAAHLSTLPWDALGALEELDLGDNPLGPAGAAAVPFGRLPQLQVFRAARTKLGPRGAARLQLARAPNLRLLGLDGNELENAGLAALALLGLSRLEGLELSRNQLGDAGVWTLARRRDAMPQLQWVALDDNGIDPTVARALGLRCWRDGRVRWRRDDLFLAPPTRLHWFWAAVRRLLTTYGNALMPAER